MVAKKGISLIEEKRKESKNPMEIEKMLGKVLDSRKYTMVVHLALSILLVLAMVLIVVGAFENGLTWSSPIFFLLIFPSIFFIVHHWPRKD